MGDVDTKLRFGFGSQQNRCDDWSQGHDWVSWVAWSNQSQEWPSVVAHHRRGRVSKEDWQEADSIWQMWFENTVWLSSFALHLKLSRVCVCVCVCVFSCSTSQFSPSVVSDSLRPHGLQDARPPCPSPTPGVYPNPCPLRRWCHPAISSSVVPFSSCLQSFLASGSFPMS